MDVTLGALGLTSMDPFGVRWSINQGGVVGWGSPDVTLSAVQKTRQAGAWAGLSYSMPRPIVIGGTAQAPTDAAALDALDRLTSAASLDDTLLTVTRAGTSRWATVRRDGAILPAWADPYSFDWSIQLVALDPRKLAAALSSATGLPATSGGVVVPFTIPFTIASAVVSGEVSLFNPGNAIGPVTFRVDGPGAAPVVTHVGSGAAQVVSTLVSLASGEWLVVDNEARTILANGTVSRANYITSRGWAGFDPGWNTWSFSAASWSAMRLTVTATPAWQ